MINRIKLALKIILGNDIIVYNENSKEVYAIINGNLDLFNAQYKVDYTIDKRIYDNNGNLECLK